MTQQTFWYHLRRLPDLSLSSYSALPYSQHDELLGQFSDSLRILHRLACCYHLEIRLWAHFDPQRVPGQRLRVMLGFSGQAQDLQKAPIDALFRATPINPYFDQADCLERMLPGVAVSAEDDPEQLAKGLFGCQVARLERYWSRTELGDETFQQHSDLPAYLHAVYPWESDTNCRLYGALKLMQQFDQPSALALTLRGSDGEQEFDRINPFYASAMAKLAGGSYKDALGRSDYLKPGPLAEQLRQLRQDMLEKLRCEPCFDVQLRCYAGDRDRARMLADTVMAEALTNGPHVCWPLAKDLGCFTVAPANMVSLKPPAGVTLPAELQRLSSLFALSEIESLFRLPVLHEGESLDLRKETYPELHVPEDQCLHLGQLQEAGSLTESIDLPRDALVKHTLVVGVPGSGKTNTLLGLANRVWEKFGVPFLALEPAKREYRGLLNLPACQGKVLLFAPGRAAPQEWLLEGQFNPLGLQINPFEFPLGYSLAEHCANLQAVFEGSLGLWQPLPSMVESAMAGAYAELGWEHGDLATAARVAECGFPNMTRFVQLLREQAEGSDYKGEVAGNVKAALELRFGRLAEGSLASVFNAPKSTLMPEEWLSVPAIVELESLGEANANFLTLLLLTYLRETLTVQKEAERENGSAPAAKLKHLLFLEEAHNLIGPSAEKRDAEQADPKAAATAYIVKMLAEVRALGQGIVIGDQLPSNLAPEVLKNTSVRICHRLTAPDDREQMKQSMNASDLQFEQMATQTSGYALVSLEGIRKPFSIRVAAADGIAARHDLAISDRAFFAAICQPQVAPDVRFAANARRLFEQVLASFQTPPLREMSTANLLKKLNNFLPYLKDETPEMLQALPPLLHENLDYASVAVDYLECCVRLSYQQAPWIALSDAEEAQNITDRVVQLEQRLDDLREVMQKIQSWLRQTQPDMIENHPAWRAMCIATFCENGAGQHLAVNPKQAAVWYRRAIEQVTNRVDFASDAAAQEAIKTLLSPVLKASHFGLWLIQTEGEGSAATKRARSLRAMHHLRHAAELGHALAQYELSSQTSGKESKVWLERAAVQGLEVALVKLNQDEAQNKGNTDDDE